MLESSSGVRCASNTASMAGLAILLIVLFIGGGLVCIGFLGLSAPLLSLGAGASCCVRVTTAERWPANNHSGWSRPLLPDHAELAALEQRQIDAARARRGWRPISRALSSRFDKRTHGHGRCQWLAGCRAAGPSKSLADSEHRARWSIRSSRLLDRPGAGVAIMARH